MPTQHMIHDKAAEVNERGGISNNTADRLAAKPEVLAKDAHERKAPVTSFTTRTYMPVYK